MPRSLLPLTLLLCSLTAIAWEDPIPENRIAPTTRAPSNTTAPSHSRGRVKAMNSQYLDERLLPRFALGWTWFAESNVKSRDQFSQYDFDSALRLGYYQNVMGGDLDSGLNFNLLFFSGSARADIPDSLLELALEFDWTWRLRSDTAIALHSEPGIYAAVSDISEDIFGLPTSLTAYRSIRPDLAVKLGAEFRPAWDVPLIPNVGLAWAPVEQVRIDVGFPETRCDWYAMRGLSLFASASWQSTSYALERGDGDPDKLSISQTRLAGGLETQLSPEIRLVAEMGLVADRHFKVEGSSESSENHDYAVDDALFCRVGIAGPF